LYPSLLLLRKHHLFPVALLESGGVPGEQISKAMNCVLITWRANRVLSSKDPVKYLAERAVSNCLGQQELVRRLQTHLVPYDQLAVDYGGLDEERRRIKISEDYRAFMEAKSEICAKAVEVVCQGNHLDLGALFHQA